MCCYICNKDIERPYWRSDAPHVVFCSDCWLSDAAAEVIDREYYAALIRKLRREGPEGRGAAMTLIHSLRGTGVPAKKPKRREHGK